MTKISVTVKTKASKQRLWNLISHPEKYPTFIKDIKDVTILKRDSSVALTHWKIDLGQTELQWTEQCQYDGEKAQISFRAIRGDFTSYAGTLSLEPTSNGTAIVLNATLDWGIPFFEKVICRVIEERTRKAFTAMLIAIKRYAEKNQAPRTYGFVIHPLDMSLISIAFREPNLVSKRKDLMSKVFEWLPPFKCSDIVGLGSQSGSEIDGVLIYCPLLPEQMMSNRGEIALKRTIEAVRIAESLGAKIVGLGAYAANIGRKGVLVAEAVDIPVTTGTAYTVAIAIAGIEAACYRVGANLNEMTVGIVGATGAIGSACAQLLAGKAGSLVLNGRNLSRLANTKQEIQTISPESKINQTTELDWLIANSDVIITATSSPEFLIDAKSLRPGTIVCDTSRPRNVSEKSVEDIHGSVLIFDGGIVRPPGEVDFDFYFGLPPGLTYACMAETMMLALAERYEGYSIGGKITSEKIAEISNLGRKLGFSLAELRWCNQEVPRETFEIVRDHIKQKVAKSWI